MADLVRADIVAKKLNVSVATVYGWAAKDLLPAVRVGPGALRFDIDEVDAFIRSRRTGAER